MGVKLTESDVVIELAKKKGVTPEEFIKDFVAKRLPDVSDSDISSFRSLINKFKGIRAMSLLFYQFYPVFRRFISTSRPFISIKR